MSAFKKRTSRDHFAKAGQNGHRGLRIVRAGTALALAALLAFQGLTAGFVPAIAAAEEQAKAAVSNDLASSASDLAETPPYAKSDSDGAADPSRQEDAEKADVAGGDAKAGASAASGADAVAPAALTGTGTQANPYVVVTADDLTAALAAATNSGTYIALKGDSAGTLDLGANTYELKANQVVTLQDAGDKVSIVRGADGAVGKKALFSIENGAKVTVTSTSDANGVYNLSYSNQHAPFARVNEGGSLTVEGGAFENNEAETYGAVFQNGWNWASGGDLKVINGLFKNNKATVIGGGVIFSNTAGTDDSQTIVEGGTFDGNVYEWKSDEGNNKDVETGGGAIHSRMGRLTVTGGVFKNNAYTSVNDQLEKNAGVSKGGGGAIFVCRAAAQSKGTASFFTLGTDDEGVAAAPKFTGNKSTAPGGAIMVSYDSSASFKAGTFEDNYAKDMGGAIYTEERTISDFGYTTVHDNIAAHFGGGLWLCPSGVSVSSRASNIALFDNVAGRDYTAADGSTRSAFELDKNRNAHRYNADDGVDGGAGDDLAIMYPNKDNVATNSVNITDSWFAGEQGAVSWYWDGQSTVRATGFGQLGGYGATQWKPSWPGKPVVFTNREAFSVTNRPRYSQRQDKIDAPRAYQQVRKAEDYPDPTWQTKGGLAFKTQVSQETKDAVNSAAKLTFVGNESGTSGGAIGSNGNLRFTSSGVAAWSKVDASDASKELGGSSWKLTWTAPNATATPYVSKRADDAIWNGATGDVSTLRWHRESADSTTWVAIVEGNVGTPGYVGYDTDATPGVFSIENLAEGTYTMTEESAPDGYAISGATYQFKVDLNTASSAIALPKIEVVKGNGTVSVGNAIANTPLPSIPDIVLKAHKTLAGGTLTAGQFSFDLDEQGSAAGAYTYTKVQQGVTNDADGNVTFDKLTYTSPGEHVYRIREQVPADATENPDGSHSKDGIVYDQTAYYVKVTVSWGWKDADGRPVTEGTAGAVKNLVASVSYFSDEACTQAIDGAAYPDYVPEFTNEVTADWQFTKTDGETNAALPGATFRLFRLTDGAQDTDAPLDAAYPGKDWVLAGESVSSDGSGGVAAGLVSFSNLASGTYRLVEVKAADGYTRPAGQWRVVVDAGAAGDATAPKVRVTGTVGAMPPAFKDNGDGTWSLPNHMGMTLPVSGASGTWVSGAVGAALVTGSLACLWWLRRRGGGAA